MDTFNKPLLPKNSDCSNNNKNIIVLLSVILIFSILGINILFFFGDIFQFFYVNLIKPFVINVLAMFGYSSGALINLTADTASNVTKTSIDIAEGTIHSIGNLLIKSSEPNISPSEKEYVDYSLKKTTTIDDVDVDDKNVDTFINNSTNISNGEPMPDSKDKLYSEYN